MQKQTFGQVVLVGLAVGWFWSLGTTGSLLAESPDVYKSGIKNDHKVFGMLKLKNPVTKVKAAKAFRKKPLMMNPVTFTIVKPPTKQENIWPVRKEIDCTIQKCIALTFDDGPSDGTPRLLDLLKSKNVKATFFMLGLQIEKFPAILNRVLAEGHEIGNHTYHHKNLKNLTPNEIATEINATQNLIYSLTNYQPHIVRPPMGEFKTDDPTLAQYPIILWSADPWDWKHRNPSIIDQETMPQIKPGSILLLHDIYPTSIDATPTIIDKLSQQGYVFVTVSELFGWKDQTTTLPKGQALRSL